MQTILITGGTGLVGKRLSSTLVEKGYRIIILTRNPATHVDTKNISYAAWDPSAGSIEIDAVKKADFIIHLAGAPVMEKRWTAKYKKEIVESRTQSSLLLAETLKNNSHHVQAIISSSAIGWYGADQLDDYAFIETDPPAKDFLGQTCVLWEQSIDKAQEQNVRVCKLRTGIVLAQRGGALEEFIKPLKMGIATILGDGNQMISWIHIDDLCDMFHHCLINDLRGSYNAVAPQPVTNKNLVISLARAMKGRAYLAFHVPMFLLKLVLGERSIEILKSTTASSKKIQKSGYQFKYAHIDAAITDLAKKID